jgi:hypothetical protein
MDIEMTHLWSLTSTDASQLDSDAAVIELQRLERCLSRLHALQADLLVTAASLEPRVDEYTVTDPRPDRHHTRTVRIVDAAREEIASALHWSPIAAGGLIEQARLLHRALPATLAALRSGRISSRHASAITQAVDRLGDRHADDEEGRTRFVASCSLLEHRVLPVAQRSTVAHTRAACRRALMSIDPAEQARRREAAASTRDVHLYDDLDGISTLVARLSTEQAHCAMRAVASAVRANDDPVLTIGEKRAAALVDLILGGRAPSVHLEVVTTLTDLLSDEPAPASLDGVEVDLDAVREALRQSDVSLTLRRLAVDPVTGVLSGVGRTHYRVPERLREFICRRDTTCRFPGCRRRAESCQIDHAIPWDEGGVTDPGNLGALCTRHHQLKTHGGWQLVGSQPDGACDWVSPARRKYRTVPSPPVPVADDEPPPF